MKVEYGVHDKSQDSNSSSYSARVLVGPTAVGKTSVAHAIARELGYDILSADAMLVYRGMDVGTAKPSASEREEVRYWGIDLASPDEPFNVGRFMEHARAALEQVAADGRQVLVVGGTGLYIKCLTEGLAELPDANPAIRADAERLLEEKGLAGLRDYLSVRDPARYDGIEDKANPRRLIRAIELMALEAPAPERKAGTALVPLMGLNMPRPMLYERIAGRAREMFDAGLVEEVRQLRDKYPALSKTALQAIGYSEAGNVLDGGQSRNEAIEQTTLRTRQLAKRQMTWFRNQARVEWVNITPEMTTADIAARVQDGWSVHGPTPLCI